MNERIDIMKGDITKLPVDAIVNAANTSLMGGGGVDGAIHRAGGPEILEECKKIIEKIGSCKTSQAVITTGGKLLARHVIHTVGPVWQLGTRNEAEKLANCHINSLKLAVENKIETIAFPNISTGVFGYPKELAAPVALKAVQDFLEQDTTIKKVYFVCFDEENFKIFESLLKGEPS